MELLGQTIMWTLTLQRKLSNTRRFKARAEPAVEEMLSKLNALKEARANGVGPSSKRRRNDSNDPSVSIVYCLLMNLFCLVYVFAIICSQVNFGKLGHKTGSVSRT